MKEFIQWLKKLWELISGVKEPLTPPLTILMLPGHGPKEGAATYVRGFNEADWNREIVLGVQEKYKGHHLLIRDTDMWRRPSSHESYTGYCRRIAKYVKTHNVDLVIEQHINSASGKAMGTEMYVEEASEVSQSYAQVFVDKFSKLFGIKKRRDDGLYKISRGDRGFYFVNFIGIAGAAVFLSEPFFANWRSDDSSQFLDDPLKGVNKMVNYYLDVFKGL